MPSDAISRRVVVVLMVFAVVLANVAFIGLGSVFDCPDTSFNEGRALIDS